MIPFSSGRFWTIIRVVKSWADTGPVLEGVASPWQLHLGGGTGVICSAPCVCARPALPGGCDLHCLGASYRRSCRICSGPGLIPLCTAGSPSGYTALNNIPVGIQVQVELRDRRLVSRSVFRGRESRATGKRIKIRVTPIRQRKKIKPGWSHKYVPVLLFSRVAWLPSPNSVSSPTHCCPALLASACQPACLSVCYLIYHLIYLSVAIII